jgi:hypothetical protein
MTPRLYGLMVERFREQNKREDRRAGGIIAASYNLNRANVTDPVFDWWDFFTEWKPPQEEQTEEEMLRTMMSLFSTKSTEGLSH